MKKIRLFSMVALLLTAGVVCNSCYGPFKLTAKLYNWNGSIGGKWANSAVFFAFWLIPVYEVCVGLDAIIFNAIEFWGGNNPISMNEGEKEIQIVKSGNKTYEITATKNKFSIKQINGPQAGEVSEIIFNPEEHSCYLNYQGELTRLVDYLPVEGGRDQVNLYLPDGSSVCLNADERNLQLIQETALAGSNYLTSME